MHFVAVFAAVLSPLQADLTVIRLKRAGIARGNISAAFPEQSKPNCALCWLDGNSTSILYNGKTLILGGAAASQLSPQSEPIFIQGLERMGLNLNDACSYLESLNRGQILISVSTSDESETAMAGQILHDLKAEGIAQEVSATPQSNAVSIGSSLSRKAPRGSLVGSVEWKLAV